MQFKLHPFSYQDPGKMGRWCLQYKHIVLICRKWMTSTSSQFFLTDEEPGHKWEKQATGKLSKGSKVTYLQRVKPQFQPQQADSRLRACDHRSVVAWMQHICPKPHYAAANRMRWSQTFLGIKFFKTHQAKRKRKCGRGDGERKLQNNAYDHKD